MTKCFQPLLPLLPASCFLVLPVMAALRKVMFRVKGELGWTPVHSSPEKLDPLVNRKTRKLENQKTRKTRKPEI